MSQPMTLLELRDAIAKAVADAIGHGMREKCERHADEVLKVVAPQLLATADDATLRQQAARVDEEMVERAVAAYRRTTHAMPQTQHDRMRAALEAALSAQPAERQGDALKSIEARLGLAIEHGNTHGWETARNEIEGILGSYYFTHPAAPVGVPDGMVLVPREPTQTMMDAGYAESAAHRGTIAVRRCYAAMLAAAPSAPQGEG